MSGIAVALDQQLFQGFLKVDIDRIAEQLPKPKDPRVQSGKLSQYDYYRIKVAGKLIEKSVASIGQTALLTYLDRNWEKHLDKLRFDAAQRGITIEELFIELASQD